MNYLLQRHRIEIRPGNGCKCKYYLSPILLFFLSSKEANSIVPKEIVIVIIINCIGAFMIWKNWLSVDQKDFALSVFHWIWRFIILLTVSFTESCDSCIHVHPIVLWPYFVTYIHNSERVNWPWADSVGCVFEVRTDKTLTNLCFLLKPYTLLTRWITELRPWIILTKLLCRTTQQL